MALFDPNTNLSLSDVLTNQASRKVDQTNDAYVQKKKRLVSQLAANGQLMGGTANYALTDLATGNAGDQADVYANLAGALGQVPTEDYATTRENDRKRRLAELIGNLNKPSSLEEALGALGAAGQVGATFAAFA